MLLVPARIFLGVGALELVAAALLEERLVLAPYLVLRRAVVNGVAGEAELGDAVHVAVIGDCHGGHAKIDRALDHVADARRAVEHGVDGMVVQVDECHVLWLLTDVLRISSRPFDPISNAIDSNRASGQNACAPPARGRHTVCSITRPGARGQTVAQVAKTSRFGRAAEILETGASVLRPPAPATSGTPSGSSSPAPPSGAPRYSSGATRRGWP